MFLPSRGLRVSVEAVAQRDRNVQVPVVCQNIEARAGTSALGGPADVGVVFRGDGWQRRLRLQAQEGSNGVVAAAEVERVHGGAGKVYCDRRVLRV